MGSRQIVLVSTAGFSVLNTEIFWREDKTKRFFSQCDVNVFVATCVLMLPLHFPGVSAVACVPATVLPAVAGTLLLQ
jgi:hypothetical protein